MREYQPAAPFNVPGKYYPCTESMVKGVLTKTYSETGVTFYCSFRAFGGTDINNNGVLVVQDTATIETWYDPNIKSNVKIVIDGVEYEILGRPENIAMRNKWLKFKIRSVRGGV